MIKKVKIGLAIIGTLSLVGTITLHAPRIYADWQISRLADQYAENVVKLKKAEAAKDRAQASINQAKAAQQELEKQFDVLQQQGFTVPVGTSTATR
jgi:hypothetical protein